LRPNGRATFAEPLAHHPLFWVARQLTPRLRTIDEHPFALADLERLAQAFSRSQITTRFLLAPFAYLLRLWQRGENLFRYAHQWLERLDSWLFKCFPFLRRFAWYGQVNLCHGSSSDTSTA
jgi:hypothetical protein